jgi:nitroreductase
MMSRDFQPMFVNEWFLPDTAMPEQPQALLHEKISLPQPRMQGGKPILDVLKSRSSCRRFRADSLPAQTLSDLLWAAFGVNRSDTHGRTAPSTENWQEIAIHVAKADGVFLYEPTDHALVRLLTTDIRTQIGLEPIEGGAPVDLIYVADFSRAMDASEEEKRLYCVANTAFIAENVYLFCASEGLGTVVRGAINRPLLASAMALGGNQRVILAQSVGFPGMDTFAR